MRSRCIRLANEVLMGAEKALAGGTGRKGQGHRMAEKLWGSGRQTVAPRQSTCRFFELRMPKTGCGAKGHSGVGFKGLVVHLPAALQGRRGGAKEMRARRWGAANNALGGRGCSTPDTARGRGSGRVHLCRARHMPKKGSRGWG